MCVCACVCVCARARAPARVCMRGCVICLSVHLRTCLSVCPFVSVCTQNTQPLTLCIKHFIKQVLAFSFWEELQCMYVWPKCLPYWYEHLEACNTHLFPRGLQSKICSKKAKQQCSFSKTSKLLVKYPEEMIKSTGLLLLASCGLHGRKVTSVVHIL